MKTFEDAWKELGYNYGEEELEGVRLGWDLYEKHHKDVDHALTTEIEAFLDRCPQAVRVCEGGGVENIAASFAVTMYKLNHPKND